MKLKWNSKLLVIVSLLAMLVAGCGGDEDKPAAGGGGDGQQEQTAVKMAYLAVASDAAMVLGRNKGFFSRRASICG
jgi:hypothetical protein